MELQRLLNLRDVNVEELENRFKDLAQLLFQEYHIQKGNEIYDFHEIEFYYYTNGHRDAITYPRITEAGKWFFHQSGVDLTFKSDSENYGGILIKSLKHGDEIISGPLKCTWILFDVLDAFDMKQNEYPLIVHNEKTEKEIFSKKRKIDFNKDDETNQAKAKNKYKEDYLNFVHFIDAEYLFYWKK